MIGINKIKWNAWKLHLMNQVINKMPAGFVKFKIEKFSLLYVCYEKKYGGVNSSF